MADFFITGAYRSGTTLLDKLLNNHPEAAALSQPAPALFLEFKKAFLQANSIEIPYQIHNDYFRESRYKPAGFTHFLDNFRADPTQIQEINRGIIEFQQKNSGYSKIIALQPTTENSLLQLYRQILQTNLENKPAKCSKEVICEEFLPYFLRHGIKCLLVLRDPRDVVASTYFGKGQEFVGSPRPFLWTIRNWRKSVAFALALSGNENLLTLRYEDLVQKPDKILPQLCKFLNLNSYPDNFLNQPLKNAAGEIWQSNSSYAATSFLSSESVGNFAKKLPWPLQHFVETVCFPEMLKLDYQSEIKQPDFSLIEEFKEPFAINRPGIDSHFSERKEEKTAEIQRLNYWLQTEEIPEELQQQYFIFAEACQQLRNKSSLKSY